MPSPKTKPAAKNQPTIAPSATSHLFADRKGKQAPNLSHERIAADIAAFRKAGGKVEVLGNTPILRSVPFGKATTATAPVAAKAAAAPAATAGRARR